MLQEFESSKADAITAAVGEVRAECDAVRRELDETKAALQRAHIEIEEHRREAAAFATVQQEANVSAGLCKSLQVRRRSAW